MLDSLLLQLKSASSVVLSTHRHCDGDGLGAQIALLHGLRQLGKQACIINPDAPPKKYAFLEATSEIGVFGEVEVPKCDLAIVLDTNDRRLVEPLISELDAKCSRVLFVDHHPVLRQGPVPNLGSVIDVSAASTGEIVFRLLGFLGVQMNAEIARALYTSVVFDTQLFRYVKSDPRSHAMAAELLKFERDPESIHRKLFATYTIEKMSFLGKALSEVEYLADGRIAVVSVNSAAARACGLDPDESADVIDLVMNIESVQLAVMIRDDGLSKFKLSFRSKGRIQVLPLAETFGGGGHPFAAGAYVEANGSELRAKLVKALTDVAGAPAKRA